MSRSRGVSTARPRVLIVDEELDRALAFEAAMSSLGDDVLRCA